MSEYEQIFHKQEMYDMYSKGEVQPLEDLYEIETLALTAKQLNEQIEFYKGLKKKKKTDIDAAIEVLKNKLEFFKKVIIATLKDKKEKGADFPGSCSVSSRKNPARWEIIDDEEFIEILQRAKKDGEKLEGAIVEETKQKIVKKEVSKLLNVWLKNGTFEKYFNDDSCVKKEFSKMGVTFTYPKELDEDNEVVDETIPVKENENIGTEDFDSL